MNFFADPYLIRLLLDAAIWSIIITGFALLGVGVRSIAREIHDARERHRAHREWMAALWAEKEVDDLTAVADDNDPQQEPGDEAMSLRTDPDNYHESIMPKQLRENPALVKKLRAIAEALAADGRQITSDDVHAEFERTNGGMKLSEIPGVDARIMAATFIGKDKWVKCGWQASERKDCHYRPVRIWALRKGVA